MVFHFKSDRLCTSSWVVATFNQKKKKQIMSKSKKVVPLYLVTRCWSDRALRPPRSSSSLQAVRNKLYKNTHVRGPISHQIVGQMGWTYSSTVRGYVWNYLSNFRNRRLANWVWVVLLRSKANLPSEMYSGNLHISLLPSFYHLKVILK